MSHPPNHERLDALFDAYLKATEHDPTVDADSFFASRGEVDSSLRKQFFALASLRESLRELGETVHRPEDTLEGRTLGDFRIVSEIGRGGMGIVYRAEQRTLKRFVALKVLSVPITMKGTAIDRFKRESTMVASLRHPGIIEIHAIGHEGDFHYFAMPLIDGANLEEILNEPRGGDIETKHASNLGSERPSREPYVQRAARVILQIGDALEHAHSKGIVHRDIKPSNILVQRDGTAILTDFGLARLEGGETLTAPFSFAGTPHYLAPELVEHGVHAADVRSDVYSLGVTLYELLTLKRPFDGVTSHRVLDQATSKPPVPLRRHDSSISKDLERVCLTAMDMDPSRRYPSARDFADDLRRFLDGTPVRARPLSPLTRTLRFTRRHPVLISTTALFALLAIVALALSMSLYRARDDLVREVERTQSVLDFVVRGYGFSAIDTERPLDPHTIRAGPSSRGRILPVAEVTRKASEWIDENPSDATALLYRYVGTTLRLLGDYPRAEKNLSRALEGLRKESPVDVVIDTEHRLALLLHDWAANPSNADTEETLERFDRARTLYESVETSLQREEAAREPRTYEVRGNLATLYRDIGDFLSTRPGESRPTLPVPEECYERAERLWREILDLPDAPHELRTQTLESLATLLFDLHRFDQALELSRKVLDLTPERHRQRRNREALYRAVVHARSSPTRGSSHRNSSTPPTLYYLHERDGGLSLHRLRDGESELIRPGVRTFAHSPSNARLAYISREPFGKNVLSVGSPDAPHADRALLETDRDLYHIAWHPEAPQLYLSVRFGEGSYSLRTVDVSQAQPRLEEITGLASLPGEHYAWPTVSADGRYLAFIRARWHSASASREVYLATLQNPTSLSTLRRLTNDWMVDDACSFSVDGTRLLWTSEWHTEKRGPATRFFAEVIAIGPDSIGPRETLSVAPGAGPITVSADGWIACFNRQDEGLDIRSPQTPPGLVDIRIPGPSHSPQFVESVPR